MLNYFPMFSTEFSILPRIKRAIGKYLISDIHTVSFNVGMYFICSCKLCKNKVNSPRCKVINKAT